MSLTSFFNPASLRAVSLEARDMDVRVVYQQGNVQGNSPNVSIPPHGLIFDTRRRSNPALSHPSFHQWHAADMDLALIL